MESFKHTYIFKIPDDLLKTLIPLGQSARVLDEHELSSQAEDSDEGEDSHELSKLALTQSSATIPYNRPLAGSSLTWYTSTLSAEGTKLGIYNCMFPNDQSSAKSIQCGQQDRTLAMFMTGGGHFAAAIISLQESSSSNCNIRASKGFHRYTTRRKQGGSQSANDNAKGAANSAGAQIRRYNEIALQEDVRALLTEWKPMLDATELILIRASGQSSRKLLYDNGLNRGDPRIRGFPLNTRRATQAEIVRSFQILTRIQVGTIDETDFLTVPIEKDKDTPAAMVEVKVDPALLAHTSKITSLIRKDKAEGLIAYIKDEKLDTSLLLEPRKTYMHTPTILHFAASVNAEESVMALLYEGASPTYANEESKTAFEVSGTKNTRDVFRIWRGAVPQDKCDWEAAKIPAGLTSSQIEARRARLAEAKAAHEAEEAERRRKDLEVLEKEAAAVREKEKADLDRKRGPGRMLPGSSVSPNASLEGLTPAMKTKIERERRARAAEARFAKK